MLADYQAQNNVPQEVCDQILEAAKESSVGEDGVRSQVKIRRPDGQNHIRYEYNLEHIDSQKNEITFYRHINYSDGRKHEVHCVVKIEDFVNAHVIDRNEGSGIANTSLGQSGSLRILQGLLLETKNSDETFDFGAYLRSVVGPPPKDMPDPHAHHILFKKGLGAEQQALVTEVQILLRKYGIDPIFGPENLVWAPNRIEGQHDIKALQQVIDFLKMTDEMFGTREEMINALKSLGKTAAERR
nr:AHH domain-containing protein [Vibrio parahaemolyticus]